MNADDMLAVTALALGVAAARRSGSAVPDAPRDPCLVCGKVHAGSLERWRCRGCGLVLCGAYAAPGRDFGRRREERVHVLEKVRETPTRSYTYFSVCGTLEPLPAEAPTVEERLRPESSTDRSPPPPTPVSGGGPDPPAGP